MITVNLTDAGIRNGYIDIPASQRAFFPCDCLGGRGKNDRGKEIKILFDGQEFLTDIRIKSGAWISPRTRFYAVFKRLGFKHGQKLLIDRTGDREYRIKSPG